MATESLEQDGGSAVVVALGRTWWAVVLGPLVDLVRVPDGRPDQAGHRLGKAGSAGDLEYPLARHVEQGSQLARPVQAWSLHDLKLGATSA